MTDKTCDATMVSKAVPGHTHTCTGNHDAGDHFCGVCYRYWWHNPKASE